MGIWKKAAKVALIGTMLLTSLACYVSVAIPTAEIAPPTEQEVAQPNTATPPSLEAVVEDEIKLCAFNVKDFGRKKIMEEEADDPDVAQGTGRALAYIMMGCDMTAVQEISDIEGKVIDHLLNNYINIFPPGNFLASLSPRLGRIASGEAQKEQYGFIYDKSKLELIDSYTFDDGKDDGTDAFSREPYIGLFRSLEGNLQFVAVVIHTNQSYPESEMIYLENVVKQVYERYPGEKDIILMGDMNLKEGFNTEIASLWGTGDFTSVIGEDTTLAKSVSLFDQIIIDYTYTGEDFTNQAGVIRFDEVYNFSVPAYVISDHYPVWILLKTDSDTDRMEGGN